MPGTCPHWNSVGRCGQTESTTQVAVRLTFGYFGSSSSAYAKGIPTRTNTPQDARNRAIVIGEAPKEAKDSAKSLQTAVDAIVAAQTGHASSFCPVEKKPRRSRDSEICKRCK